MTAINEKRGVQIEITNACRFSCTNCYKFVGHHVAPRFMDVGMVKKAIDSLHGYRGEIGITGGEPTLHPDFAEICEYLRKKVAPEQRVLQTTGYKWNDYKSVIRKTFSERVQYNDHKDATQKHQPMLVAIKDVVPDQSLRKELIDHCWVKERWSASITCKGCFSCEVAGAFDSLLNGPGGLPIEKGWWAKSHEHFAGQMDTYCEQCGGPLPQPAFMVDNIKDLVSISNLREIEKLKTPKFQINRVRLATRTYSAQDIETLSAGWAPWNNKGIEGHGTDILRRYGGVGSMLGAARRKVRTRSKVFRRYERRLERLFWRFSIMSNPKRLWHDIIVFVRNRLTRFNQKRHLYYRL